MNSEFQGTLRRLKPEKHRTPLKPRVEWELDFIESTGLGALIGGRRRAHALKGSLSLVCNEDQVLKIFRITGLDKVFTIYKTVDEAVARPLAG